MRWRDSSSWRDSGELRFTDEVKEDLWEKGLWRLALIRAGEALPVPESITTDLITTLPPSELTSLLWDYLCVFLEESGCYRLNGPYEKTVLGLPRGLRAVHNLTALDSEVQNGGFDQFFTNSSGSLARETLDDLRMIGATAHFDLLLRAIALNDELEAKYPFSRQRCQLLPPGADPITESDFDSDVDNHCAERFDRLSDEFYALEKSDSLWKYFDRYLQDHAQEFVHSRSPIGC